MSNATTVLRFDHESLERNLDQRVSNECNAIPETRYKKSITANFDIAYDGTFPNLTVNQQVLFRC